MCLIWSSRCSYLLGQAFNKLLQRGGFTPVDNYPSCYWHSKYQSFLFVYVDDFKMACPVKYKDKVFKAITDQGIVIDEPQPAHLYLGCIHEYSDITLPNGNKARECKWKMEHALRGAVRKYKALVTQITGKPPMFRKVTTPFLTEDQSKTSPQGAPASDGPAVECPWCKHTFPFTQLWHDNGSTA